MRVSYVVYILIRLPTSDGHSLLLRHHEKWGDWSLVGGHVEDPEMDNWQIAAEREANEELIPLVSGIDFAVAPLHPQPVTWGPEPSRSARGERTTYKIQYFTLSFLRDPVILLGKLPSNEFWLLRERELESMAGVLGRPVHRAQVFFGGSLNQVRPAWKEDINTVDLPSGLLSSRGLLLDRD